MSAGVVTPTSDNNLASSVTCQIPMLDTIAASRVVIEVCIVMQGKLEASRQSQPAAQRHHTIFPSGAPLVPIALPPRICSLAPVPLMQALLVMFPRRTAKAVTARTAIASYEESSHACGRLKVTLLEASIGLVVDHVELHI